MAKTNKICFLCGTKYHYCPTCNSDINKPSWYAMWCSEQCKDLDRILAAHTTKQISTEEAKDKIKDLKLKNIKFNDENVERHYNEIMSYKDKIEENVKVENNSKVTTTTTTNSASVKTIKEKPVNSKYQNNKK